MRLPREWRTRPRDAAQRLDRLPGLVFLQAGDEDARVVEVGTDLDLADRGEAEVESCRSVRRICRERVADVLADS